MAFDGFTLHSINYELYNTLLNGRISKITQHSKDQIILFIKVDASLKKLLISVNSSHPFLSFTTENRQAPKTAPTFCMVLRKYLQNGKITNITQPDFDRIIKFEIEHYNEMLDLKKYYLVCEFMGKHSNLILLNDEDFVIDSIKRIPSSISSVRKVLPGEMYFVPNLENKTSPINISKEDFFDRLFSLNLQIQKAIYTAFHGFSPQIANEVCEKANVLGMRPANSLSLTEKEKIYLSFLDILNVALNHQYFFATYDDLEKKEFSSIKLLNRIPSKTYEAASLMLFDFYDKKEKASRMKQASFELRKLVTIFLERANRKLLIQEAEIKKTRDMDKYNLYGELLKAYAYCIKPNLEEVFVDNYYENKKIRIPLKKELNAIENSNRYYKRYNKLKRTFTLATRFLEESKEEIKYLSSVYHSLLIAKSDDDISLIRKELEDTGYLHKKIASTKNKNIKSEPLHFLTSSGKDVYVGKNNAQNEYITFKLANATDWWFHVKDAAGSHVIIKSNGKELTDTDYEEAAALAAHFSSINNQKKVEVDYIQRGALKKPSSYKIGMVIYNTNYSLIADTQSSYIKSLDL